ncbi:MAG TPA: YHS domain-containing protein [Candidatus Saccharimonadales bacterium]|nr:YHS domain-containing protein [Candidatus Saccharimonadales bacterium]
MPFENDLWSDEWERRKIRGRLHLTFSGCLGPCAVGNNALLQIWDRSIWLKDLNVPALVPAVFDYIEATLSAGRVLPVPDALTGHIYERYLTPEDAVPKMSFGADPTDDQLDGLDPVCFMEVDLATARHTAEYDGRTIGFCAPSCKKLFLADPGAYLGSTQA